MQVNLAVDGVDDFDYLKLQFIGDWKCHGKIAHDLQVKVLLLAAMGQLTNRLIAKGEEVIKIPNINYAITWI